jgi:Cu(I)/Ag(I) efflux system membrane fusion protein
MKKPAVIGAFLALALTAFLAGRFTVGSSRTGSMTGTHILYYVDPMHPAYRSDKPGIAPDCGMPLVPVFEGDDPASKLQLLPGAVYIDPEKRRLIGVSVEPLEKNSGMRLIRTTGRVEADQNRVHRLMAGAEGWVESVENNTTGTIVKKDELLATLYSRDFRNAEQAYLGSIASLDRLRGNHDQEDPTRMSDANMRINEEQLRSLGMGEPQIRDLAKTRQISRDITLTAPINGIVLSRNVAPGQRFETGNEFYTIADLSDVWITADLFGNGVKLFHPGERVRFTARELPNTTMYATVSNDPPVFDPVSRTSKLRLEAKNPDLVLRPDMFVDLEFSTMAPPGLSIPQEAVLDSGVQKVVYVETSDGVFEPRRVTLGTAYGDSISVTSGLKPGERIVISGNFLIDSESRMHSAVRASTKESHGMERHSTTMREPSSGRPVDANQVGPSKSVEASVAVGNHPPVQNVRRGLND